jgi:hypothetical protein
MPRFILAVLLGLGAWAGLVGTRGAPCHRPAVADHQALDAYEAAYARGYDAGRARSDDAHHHHDHAR